MVKNNKKNYSKILVGKIPDQKNGVDIRQRPDPIMLDPKRIQSYRKNANNFICPVDDNNILVGYLTPYPKAY